MDLSKLQQLLNNGNISWQSFSDKAAKTPNGDKIQEQLNSIFSKIDVDKNGEISKNELEEYIKDFNILNVVQDDVLEDSEIANATDDNILKNSNSADVNTFNEVLELISDENTQKDNDLSNLNNPLDSLKKDSDGNYITYPKNGESFNATAKRLGYELGTEEYNAFVSANKTSAKRKWFKVGEEVKIPNSLKDKIDTSDILDENASKVEVSNYRTKYGSTVSNDYNSKSAKTKEENKITLGSGRYIIKSKEGIRYYAADGVELNKSYFESKEGVVTVNKSGRYMITKDGTTRYYAADGTELNETDFKKQEKISTYKSKTGRYTLTQNDTVKYYNKDGVEISSSEYIQAENKSAPKKMQDVANDLKKMYGGDPLLQYNEKTKSYDVIINNPNDKNVKSMIIHLNNSAWQENLSQTEAAIKGVKDAWNKLNLRAGNFSEAISAGTKNKNENIQYNDYISGVDTTYVNGKVTQSTYVNGKEKVKKEVSSSNTTTNKTSQQKANSAVTDDSGEHITQAATIKFNIPSDAPQAAKDFCESLCDNKEDLMRVLGIDNDTYNMLAQTAVGIAGQETQFGTSSSIAQTSKDILRMPNDSIAKFQFKHGLENTSNGRDWSQGITQLKFTLWNEDPVCAKQFKALGITNEVQLHDPKVAAKATMVVLARLNQQIDASEKRQNGIKAAQDTTVTIKGYEMGSDGVARKTADGSTKSWTNKLTRQDILCAFYNGGRAKAVINGTFVSSWEYSNNVRNYANQYNLVEDETSRAEAKDKSEQTAVFKNMDNSGNLGGVVFLPAMYSDKSRHLNNTNEISNLKQILTKKGLDNNLINQLVTALQNGELSFDFGLTQTEIESLTNGDIKSLLLHLNKLKKQVNADKSINTSDGISNAEAVKLRTKYATAVSREEANFRSEYLTNHSEVYSDSGTKSSVLRELSTNNGSTNYVSSSGNRVGFRHETPMSVNTNTNKGTISKKQEILANAGYSVALKNSSNSSSGKCLTGVKQAFTQAGIDVSDMSNYGSEPKYVKNWFDRHTELFTKVESISIGDGKARDITAADLKSLPAGYVVIWLPESGSEQAGHIEITNGNGQGYADATDNIEWNVYTSGNKGNGKGEHGRFLVYKLADNVKVGADGKLHT